MARPELHPFADEHLAGAAALLAARHRAHRAACPRLPARFEEPGAAQTELEALWAADGASGSVAVRDGRLTGYVLGGRKDDRTWGPNAWVLPAGHAAERPEDVRDLWAHAAARWAEEGRTRMFADVPATDEGLLDAWFRLGFGAQHAFAAVAELPRGEDFPDGVREARPEDVDELVELSLLLGVHHGLTPVFAPGVPDDPDELRAELLEDLADEDYGFLVAEGKAGLSGYFSLVPVELSGLQSGLARPEGLPFLAYAATRPEARGTGAGLALARGAFAWARRRGHEAMATDWRVANLEASRFWPARGFRPGFLRLYRALP